MHSISKTLLLPRKKRPIFADFVFSKRVIPDLGGSKTLKGCTFVSNLTNLLRN